MEFFQKSQKEKNSFIYKIKDFISLSRNRIDSKISTILKILCSMKEDNEQVLFQIISLCESNNIFLDLKGCINNYNYNFNNNISQNEKKQNQCQNNLLDQATINKYSIRFLEKINNPINNNYYYPNSKIMSSNKNGLINNNINNLNDNRNNYKLKGISTNKRDINGSIDNSKERNILVRQKNKNNKNIYNEEYFFNNSKINNLSFSQNASNMNSNISSNNHRILSRNISNPNYLNANINNLNTINNNNDNLSSNKKSNDLPKIRKNLSIKSIKAKEKEKDYKNIKIASAKIYNKSFTDKVLEPHYLNNRINSTNDKNCTNNNLKLHINKLKILQNIDWSNLSNKEKSFYFLAKSPVLNLRDQFFFFKALYPTIKNIISEDEIFTSYEKIILSHINKAKHEFVINEEQLKSPFTCTKIAEITLNFITSNYENEFKEFVENEKENNKNMEKMEKNLKYFFSYIKILFYLINEKFDSNIKNEDLISLLYEKIKQKGFSSIKDYLYNLFISEKREKKIFFGNIEYINEIKNIVEEEPEILNNYEAVKICRFIGFSFFLVKELIMYIFQGVKLTKLKKEISGVIIRLENKFEKIKQRKKK